MITLLYNTNLVLIDRVRRGYLAVQDDRILTVGFGDEYPNLEWDQKIDLQGLYLAPGFVELHSHGAGGCDFMDGTLEAFTTAANTHLQHGTTTLLPTALAATREEILRTIRCFREAKPILDETSLRIHGLHMEGPYLNLQQCGAIDPKYIRNPEPEEYEEFLETGRGAIARWTLAVELPGADHFAERLLEEGIVPSVGHSNAEYCQVKKAYEGGVHFATHLYSAMSSIVRKGGFRHSGVLESTFCLPEMDVEIIADGCHLPAELLEMVYRVKGVEHVALTCDSMRCAGQNVKESILGSLEKGQKVIIEDDVAKMPDRTAFAGSIATDDRLVRTMVHKAGVPLYDAVRMMTLTPARIIGVDSSRGSLEAGKLADLVCFDDNINISGVMVGGKGRVGLLAQKG